MFFPSFGPFVYIPLGFLFVYNLDQIFFYCALRSFYSSDVFSFLLKCHLVFFFFSVFGSYPYCVRFNGCMTFDN